MLKLVRIYSVIDKELSNYFRILILLLYIAIGSVTLSALSGKIMFRDIVYITTDYSFRIQDGWLIFRWWRSYVPKDVSEGKYFS